MDPNFFTKSRERVLTETKSTVELLSRVCCGDQHRYFYRERERDSYEWKKKKMYEEAVMSQYLITD